MGIAEMSIVVRGIEPTDALAKFTQRVW